MSSGDAPGFPRSSGSANQASSSGYGQPHQPQPQYGAQPPSGFLGSAWSNLLTTNHASPMQHPGQGNGISQSTFSAHEVHSTSMRAQYSSGTHSHYAAMQTRTSHQSWQQTQQPQQHSQPQQQQYVANVPHGSHSPSSQHYQTHHTGQISSNAPPNNPYSSLLQGRSSPAQQPSSQPPATATRAAAQFAQYHAQRPGRFTSAWSNSPSSSSPGQQAVHAGSSPSSADPSLPPIASPPGYHHVQPQSNNPSMVSATVSPPQSHAVPPQPSFAAATQSVEQDNVGQSQASYPPSGPATFPAPVQSSTAAHGSGTTAVPSLPANSSQRPVLRSPTSETRTSLDPGRAEQSFSQLRMFAHKFEAQHHMSHPQSSGTPQATVHAQGAQQVQGSQPSGSTVQTAAGASATQTTPQNQTSPPADTVTGTGTPTTAPRWSRQLVPATSSSSRQSTDLETASPQSSQKDMSRPSEAPSATPATPTAATRTPTSPTSVKSVHSRVVPITDTQVSPPRKIVDIASSRSAGHVRPSDLTRPMYALESFSPTSVQSASQELQSQQATTTPAPESSAPAPNAPTNSAITAAASAVSQVLREHPPLPTPNPHTDSSSSSLEAPPASSQDSQVPSTEYPAPKPKAGRGRPRGSGPRQLEARRQQEAREAAVKAAMISEGVDPDAHPGMLAAVLAAAQPTKVPRRRKSATPGGTPAVSGSPAPAGAPSDTEIAQAIGEAMQTAAQPIAQAISTAIQTVALESGPSRPRRSTTPNGTPRKVGRPKGSGPLQRARAAATRAAIMEAGLDPDTVAPEVKATFEAKFKYLRPAKPDAGGASASSSWDSSSVAPAPSSAPVPAPSVNGANAVGQSTTSQGASLVARAAASTSALTTAPAMQTKAAPRTMTPQRTATSSRAVPLSVTSLAPGSVAPHLVGPTLWKYVQMRASAAAAASTPPARPTASAPGSASQPRSRPSASPRPPQNRAVVDLTRQSPIAPRTTTNAATAEVTLETTSTPVRATRATPLVDRVVVDLTQQSPVRPLVAPAPPRNAKAVGPVNRAEVVIPITKARELIARGVYDPFRDDTDLEPEPVGRRPPRVRVAPMTKFLQVAVPRGAALRQQRIREPEPIRDRFELRSDMAMLEPWASVLTKESLLNRVGEYTCEWKGCGAQLATEAWLLRHVIARDHAGQAKFDFGGLILYQCHWRGCDGPSFRTPQGLVQHITAKHVCDRLDCPYEKCDLRSPTISHLYRHVMRTHDGGEQPRPRADLPFNPPRLELQPLPDTVTTVELTTRPARGKSHKTERYQEYARAKVQRLCFAPPNPEIHIIHPPHMLQPVDGEEDTLPGTREATREATDAEADADGSVQFALDDGMDVDADSGAEDSEAVTEDVVVEEIVVAVEDSVVPAERESSTPRATQSRKRKRESNGPPNRQMARRTGARAGVAPSAGPNTRTNTGTGTTQQNGQPTRQTARRTGAAPLPAMPLSATPRTRSVRGVEPSSPANGTARATRSGIKAVAEDGKGKGKARALAAVEAPSRTTRSGRALGVKTEPGERQFFSHVEVPKIDTSGYRRLEIP